MGHERCFKYFGTVYVIFFDEKMTCEKVLKLLGAVDNKEET